MSGPDKFQIGLPSLPERACLPFFLLFALALAVIPAAASAEVLKTPEVLVEEQIPEHDTLPVPGLPVDVIEVRVLPPSCQDVGAALRSATGLKLTEFGSPGHGSVITLRGGGSQPVLVLRDGIPLSSSLGGGPDLSLIPLSSIEKIEVYRGGMGTFFGSSAMSGAVNIVSRDAGVSVDRMELTAGSFGLNRERYSHSRRGYRVDLERFHSIGDFPYRSVNGLKRTRENNEAEREEVSIGMEIDGGRVRVRHTMLDREEPGLAEFPSLLAESESAQTSADVELDDVALGPGWMGKAFFSYRDFSFRDPEPFLGPALDTDQQYFDFGAAARKETFFGDRDIVTTAFSARREQLNDHGYGDPARVTCQTGVNWERFAAGGTWTVGILGESADDFGEALSWRLGWEGRIGDRLMGFASAGRGFRFPAFNELYLPDQGSIAGNPDLAKETSRDLQAGVRLEADSWSAALTAFNTRYAESILFTPVSAWRIEPINTGAARVNGLELSLEWKPAPDFLFGGNFTFQEPLLLSTKERLIGRSRHKGSAWVSGSWRGWDLRMTHDYEGSLYTDMYANQSVKPKHSTGLLLARDVSGWRVSGELRNLFDQNLRDSRDLPLPGRTLFISLEKEL